MLVMRKRLETVEENDMRSNLTRRYMVMLGGILIMGLGVALFRFSGLGNDPATALVIAASDRTGVALSIVVIAVNSLWFCLEVLFGRKYLGAGTFVNWFAVGPLITFFSVGLTSRWPAPQTFFSRLMVMGCGVLILSLAAALYQTADLGVSPYDSVSVVLAERTPIPYFWCRIFTDSFCTAVTFILGGTLGLGTLVCSLGLGPFIGFFTRHVALRLCGIRNSEAGEER